MLYIYICVCVCVCVYVCVCAQVYIKIEVCLQTCIYFGRDLNLSLVRIVQPEDDRMPVETCSCLM